MKTKSRRMKVIFILLACSVIVVTATSFQDTPSSKLPPLPKILCDTPVKNTVHIDIDLKELNQALAELNIELKGLNFDKISKEIDLSLNSIDVDKITKEANQSIQNVDWEKIKNDVHNSLKDINFDEIKINIKKAGDEIKANINSERFKKNMKSLKKIDTIKLNKEIKKAQKEIEKNKSETRNKIINENGNETTIFIDSQKITETTLPGRDRLFFLI